MKKLFFLPLAIICLQAFSQNDIQTKYAGLITGTELRKHLTIIASDAFEGRETGTEGQRKAAAYIENEFIRMGLKKPMGLNSYQQFYPLTQDSIAMVPTLTINGLTGENGKDFLIPLSQNDNANFRSNKLVFAGYGIDDGAYSDYNAINVKGKVVVIFLGEPKKDGKYFIEASGKNSAWTYPGISKKLDAAKARGAVGVL